ncbi:MAG: flavodoxin-dependent (E)-4-hydroxy-3-methylbut-2-enyl-diphosphate synthase [Ruminococcaceae bacterium]|nr:flavodoxin-dependent (E)-4-hydroxy-3-methylbut-2-enyl-diphosphate synthase [Oscillospiraceae bacterium]
MDYNSIRRKTRGFTVGFVGMGADHPISIQSMTNTDTHDKEATYQQTRRLSDAGCDIVRLALPDIKSAETIYYIKEREIPVPLVADIHFDYRIALAAIDAGVDKIRINPGNIGSREKTEAVVKACIDKKIPIRIGVNSGSVEKSILEKYGTASAEALVESALSHLKILDELDFRDVAISVKASNVPTMLRANRLLAKMTDCPIHLGVTEAGARTRALVKSSIGIGALLSEGIGDTVRVSLTDDPCEEISAAKEIISALEIGKTRGMDIVSCPTCGRTKISLISMLKEFEAKAKDAGLLDMDVKVALMGCAVNGPGEAREADIGIAGGIGEGLLFKKGEQIRKIKEEKLVDELIRELKIMKDVKK